MAQKNEFKYMTAKALAALLLEHPDDIVGVPTSNFEQGNSIIPKGAGTSGLHRYYAKIEKQGFHDAFDGENYSSEVIQYVAPIEDKKLHQKKLI
jgi:hypothetical protein